MGSLGVPGGGRRAEVGRVLGVLREGWEGTALLGRERGGEGARDMVRGVVAMEAKAGSGSGPHSLQARRMIATRVGASTWHQQASVKRSSSGHASLNRQCH